MAKVSTRIGMIDSGSIIKDISSGKVGSLIQDSITSECTLYCEGDKDIYSVKDLPKVEILNIERPTDEEFYNYIKSIYYFGNIIKMHKISEIAIFECSGNQDDKYRLYVNYLDTHTNYGDLDEAILGGLAYKYQNPNEVKYTVSHCKKIVGITKGVW